MTELEWVAPGPGTWHCDLAHGGRPVSPAVQELFPAAMIAGFQAFTPAYGLPVSHIEIRYVNGYPYSSVQMGDLSAREVPPPVAAEQAMSTRLWREQLRSWRDDLRPALVGVRRALQRVDLSSLDDHALAAHLLTVADEFTRGMTVHFALVGATVIPVGDFLAHCRGWGFAPEECLALLVGEHPLTVACGPARAALAGATPRSLEDARALAPAEVGELVDTVGCWTIGRYDITGRTLGEEGGALLAAVLAQPPTAPSAAHLRAKVPADAHELFDELLAEARQGFSARDDHAVVGGMWTIGIMRRAFIEVGQRLGLGDLVFHASCTELAAALGGDDPDLRVRVKERSVVADVAAAATPPPQLGDGGFGAGPPPGFEMPGALGRVLAAMFTYLEAMNGTATPMGIGTGVARGRAVVAIDPEDALDRIEPGDILVTTTTTPAFGAVFPLLAGVVAASGGPLSHTAIVARELGIPAVVGAADALVRIADGVEIEVDAAAGEVRVV